MAEINQVWNWSDFSWWEWDWQYYWPEWWYRAGNNLETRQLENWVVICNKLTDTSQTYLWNIISVNNYEPRCFVTIDSTNYVRVYRNWTFLIPINTWTTAYDRVIGWGKMTRLSDTTTYNYAFTMTNSWVWKIHRFDVWMGGFSISMWTWTLWEWRTWNPAIQKVITLSLPWRIIFAYWNSIFEISNSEVVTRLLVLPKEVDIVAITQFQDTYKIFYNWERYSWWVKDWFIAYWDWWSELIDQYVEYDSSPIINVVNDWPYDYTVFWDWLSSDLYYVWWLQRWNPIRTNLESDVTNNNVRQLATEWGIREWILYLTWTNKLVQNCLYSFGNYYSWSRKQLVPQNITTLNFDKINVWSSFIELYVNNAVSTWTWKIYTKSYQFWAQPESQAKIYSYALTWNYWMFTIKTIQAIYVAYQLFNANDSIKIYYKKDWWPYSTNGANWVLLKTITWSDYINKRWVKISRAELNQLELSNFYQLELYAELNATSTKSPILYPIRTIYIDNIWD